MESPDLNRRAPEPDDAALDAWLRQPVAQLPDDRFTARVLQALPPPRPSVPAVRSVSCLVGLVAGVAVAGRAISAGGGAAVLSEAWREQWSDLQALLLPSLASSTGAALVLAAVVTLGAVAYGVGFPRRFVR